MSTSEGQIVAGKYRLRRPLTEGGMGALWVAEHVELETPVAVKRLHDWSTDAAAVARFRREAKASASLSSRHIVRVFDFGLDTAGPYLVMELLRGEDVSSLLAREGALPALRVRGLLRQAVKALRAAHDAGVVHRDIKPSNLFLAQEEGEEVLKVLDFGIAKELTAAPGSSQLTGSGMLVGSPGYMSPEQVRGQPIDVRTDLWSLGLVVYEMLTDHQPFLREHLGDSLARVCEGSYPALSTLRPELPAHLDAFFARALAVDREERFHSVEELLAGFEAALDGRVGTRLGVRPPSTPPEQPDAGRASPGALRAFSLAPTVTASESPETPNAGRPSGTPRDSETLDASHLPVESSAPSSPRARWIPWASLLVLVAGGGTIWSMTTVEAPGPDASAESNDDPAEPTDEGPPRNDASTDRPALSQTGAHGPEPVAPAVVEGRTEPPATSPASLGSPAGSPATAQPRATSPTKTSSTTGQTQPSSKQPTKPSSTPATTQATHPPKPQGSAPSTIKGAKPTAPPKTLQSGEATVRRDPFTGLIIEDKK